MLNIFLHKFIFLQRMWWPTHSSLNSIVFLSVKQKLLIAALCYCHGLTWPGQNERPTRAYAIAETCLQVYAWGWGRYGNLGDGERSDRQGHTDFAACPGMPLLSLYMLRRAAASQDSGTAS